MEVTVATWIAVVIGCALSSGFASETTDKNVTSGTGSASPSGGVLPPSPQGAFTGEYTGAMDLMQPEYVILQDGEPCLLASFNISLALSYKVPSSIPQQTADRVVTRTLPAEAQVKGSCGQNVSTLSLTWDDGAITLELVFQSKEGSSNDSTVWAATNATLIYSTANETLFPDAVDRARQSLSRHGLSLFEAPMGRAFMCRVDEKVLATSVNKTGGAAITFKSVHLQPFLVNGTVFTNSTDCEADSMVSNMERERYIVPIVVAVSLVIIVLVIIASYAVSRRINSARDQQAYRSMD